MLSTSPTPNQEFLEGGTNLDFQEGSLDNAEDVSTFSASPRPDQDFLEGRADLDFQGGKLWRTFRCSPRHHDLTRISWKGIPTWISRKDFYDDVENVSTFSASSRPNQDFLEGRADLDFQEGKL